MDYVNLFGIWENQYGMSFKLTDKVKEAIAKTPSGVYVNIKKNQFKQESKHPDYKAGYKVDTGRDAGGVEPQHEEF